MTGFSDRHDAGRQLARAMGHLRGRDMVVIGIAPGGVIVAQELARAFGAPLEVVAVRDIGAPLEPEIPIAAVAADASFVDSDRVRLLGVTPRFLSHALVRATWEVRGRDSLYRGRRQSQALHGKCVILADDGTASGAGIRAAVASIRRQVPRQVHLALPVCGPDHPEIAIRADGVVCLARLGVHQSARDWYHDFPSVSEEEVLAALRDADAIAMPPSPDIRP